MREILFRGQTRRKGEKVWLDGSPVASNWVCGSGVFQGKGNFSTIYQVEPKLDKCTVYTDTIGQYTGLTDKNGKKIFEGDIVICFDRNAEETFTAIVEFGNPNGQYNWGFQLKPVGKTDLNTDILLWVEMEETGAFIRVVGHIHDNPDLLKGEKQ